jgi:hypothetical protein
MWWLSHVNHRQRKRREQKKISHVKMADFFKTILYVIY